MIAIISSTIFPSNNTDRYNESIIPIDLRFEQTIETINSLTNLGILEIYFADNSGKR